MNPCRRPAQCVDAGFDPENCQLCNPTHPNPPPADEMEAARKFCRLMCDDGCAMDEPGKPPCTAENCLVIDFAEKRAAEARREALKEVIKRITQQIAVLGAVLIRNPCREQICKELSKLNDEFRALAEQQQHALPPPEHPTEAMIEAGVRMHQTPRSGPVETLVHDIYQAMDDAWRAEQP